MKKAAVIGLVLVLAGAVVFGAGYVLTGGDFSRLNGSVGGLTVNLGGEESHSGFGGSVSATPTPEASAGQLGSGYTTQTYAYGADEVSRVVVDEAAANIYVGPSTDGQVHVTAMENKDYSYDISCREGVLSLRRRSKNSVQVSVGVTVEVKLELLLPDGLSLEVNNDCGDVELSGLSLVKAELDSDCGNILLDGVEVEKALSVQNDAGEIDLRAVSAGTLSVENDCGSVTLQDVTAESVEVECDLGEIEVANVFAANRLCLDNDCGDIQLSGVSAGKSIELSCSLGSISGWLNGAEEDYRIRAKVDLGECNLPQSSQGGIALNVDVDCGSVALSFAG